MRGVVRAMLEGMPEPSCLHLERAGGRCLMMVGSAVLAEYAEADTVMRNFAVTVARSSGFGGKRVAEVFGLSAAYVATLHAAAQREGSAALVKRAGPGRPRTLDGDVLEKARQLRASGVSDREIGRRLGVAGTTAGRRLGPQVPEPAGTSEPEGEAAGCEALVSEDEASGAAGKDPAPGPGPEAVPVPPAPAPAAVPVPGAGAVPPGGLVPAAGGVVAEGTAWSRYAGAMLLHAFAAHAGAGQVLAAAAGGDRGGTRLLAAVSACFGLGAATTEQFKHLAAAEAGPLAGLVTLPDLRTLRPALAGLAGRADPLELQAMFAQAMLDADPVTSGVYYVDDHFVPYTGAKPVPKGWNNKRGRAEKGRAGTHVTAHDGRAVCFTSGEPSGLSVTLPKALAELKRAVPPGTPVMLGFDRGGAYPQVFRHCREEGVHWVTYRRAPPGGPVLTSDFDSCPAEILAWLKSRWREENFLKYASQNYGIDKICDYAAAIETNTKVIDNPARKAANANVRQAEKNLAAAREGYAAMLADPAIPAPAKNARLIPAAQKRITRAGNALARAEAARDHIPAKLPANVIDPHAQVALLRAGRRGLQMVLRLLAHNAEHWLATHLNAYLRDDDEYRAITRETIIRGLAGTITYTPRAITVQLQQPDEPRVTRALGLLLDEINAAPPSLPGDTRPITYRLGAAGQI